MKYEGLLFCKISNAAPCCEMWLKKEIAGNMDNVFQVSFKLESKFFN